MKLHDYLNQPAIKVSEFAEKVGRDPSVVARWKRNEVTPDWKLWSVIERATDGVVTRDDFIGCPVDVEAAE